MNKSKHTFFCPLIDSGLLGEDEAGHASRVLRLQVNDMISIINGKGLKVEAAITEISKKSLSFKVQEEIENVQIKSPLHIAIAPTKSNDRFNFFLEKVTELGLAQISPIQSSNSERKIFKRDKAEKTLISALKQSGNLHLPQLNEMVSFKEFIERDQQGAIKYIAHCEEDQIKQEFKTLIENNERNIVILIGPEGDFTPEEITLAKENNYIPVSLGKTRLRTETAGIIACHTVYLQY